MKPLSNFTSTAVPVPMENIDTDQIIPARFLKATTREGFGDNLFRDWRFDEHGNHKHDFVINDPTWRGEILIAGKNFGCGSSREHAAWALADYGFSVVISSFFADIFRNNALNNGILPVQVEQDILNEWMEAVTENPDTAFEIDVPAQTVTAIGKIVSFDISNYKKTCLINGYDDIDYLLSLKEEITAFAGEATL